MKFRITARPRRLTATLGALVLLATTLALLPIAEKKASAALPSGFIETTAFSGLTNPTVLKFAPDGRIYVAEKSGMIKVFDNLNDTTATVFADLRTNVHNYWDRGLLGMVLDPNFATHPYIYILYTYDAAIGGVAPRWGTPGATSDTCPNPPGANGDGCVVSGRLSRIQVMPDGTAGPEQVLINDWCQQFPSHSVGSLDFGADGMLYASGGDGASFNYVDYGQTGNPCGDPGGPTPTPPTAEGGALRSQDYRTTADPTGLNGTVIRVDPTTGDGVPGNPMFSSTDPNARRIIAAGLRNPFRLAHRPGTNEIYVGDVGWNDWEEINRISNPTDGNVRNFGWPCYEGNGRQPGYDGTDLNLCESLYAQGSSAVTAPLFTYNHAASVVPGDGCTTGSSSVSGAAFDFYSGGAYPAAYNGALFFADYSRYCIWVMMPGANGLPNPANIQPFVTPATAGPVHLEISPQGELFYAGFDTGQIRRIQYVGTGSTCTSNQFKAEYFNGTTPGTTPVFSRCETTINNDWGTGGPGNGVGSDNFSARWTGSFDFTAGTYDFTTTSDAGMRLWVDNVAVIDDWTPGHEAKTDVGQTTLTAGPHNVKVEFWEGSYKAVAKASWAPGVSPQSPTAVVDTPTAGTTWVVNTPFTFSGHATDPQQGTLPDSALSWELDLQHCPSNCHTHVLQTWTGVSSGSFVAPDHEYPSYMELKLTATDADGNTNTTIRRLDPRTVNLTFQSNPAGRDITVGAETQTAPFTKTVIIGSSNSISAPSPQTAGTSTYNFNNWSDGGAQTHNITAPATAATYTANFDTSTGGFTPEARINFQPAGAPIPTGYLADTGNAFALRGNGRTYGWNVGLTGNTRDRNNAASPDQRYDTHILTQAPDSLFWELVVPNGTYRVRMVCGDPTVISGAYRYNVEGVRACDAVPTAASPWVDVTVTVTVTDGRLTVTNAPGASGNKLDFLDIDRAT